MEKAPLPSEINEKNSWPVTNNHSSFCDGRSRGWPGRGACDLLKCNDASEWPSWECSQRNKYVHTDGMNGGVLTFTESLDEQRGPARVKICSSDRDWNLSIKQPSGINETNSWPVTKDTNSCDGQSSKWPDWDACNSSKRKSSSGWPSWGSSQEYKDAHKDGTIDKGARTFSGPSLDEQRGATKIKESSRDKNRNCSSKRRSEINERNSRRVANDHSSSHDGQSSKWPDWDACNSSKHKSSSGWPSWGSSQEYKDVHKDGTIDKGARTFSGPSLDEQRGTTKIKESIRDKNRNCSSKWRSEINERNSRRVANDHSSSHDGQSSEWPDWNACASSKCNNNSGWPSWGSSQENKDVLKNGTIDNGVLTLSESSFDEQRGQDRLMESGRGRDWSHSSELPSEISERNSCHVTKDQNLNDAQSGGWTDGNACHLSKCASNSEWPSWGFSQENKDMHKNVNVDNGVSIFSDSSFNEQRGQGRVRKRSKDTGWSRRSRWGKSSLGSERSAGRDFSRSPSNGPRQASYSLSGKKSVFEMTSRRRTNVRAHVSGWGEETDKSLKGSMPDKNLGLSKRPKSTPSRDWVADTAENSNFHYPRSRWGGMSKGTIKLSDSTRLIEVEEFTKQGGDKKKSWDACNLDNPKASGWHGRSTYERDCHDLIDTEKASHDDIVKTNWEMAIPGQDKKDGVNGETLWSPVQSGSGGLNLLASKETVDQKEQIHIQSSECSGSIRPPSNFSNTNESSLALFENPSNGFDMILDELVKHHLLVKMNQMQVQFDETVKMLQEWASLNSVTTEQAARLSKLEAYITLISEYGRQIFSENSGRVHLNSNKVWGCENLRNNNLESSATMLRKLESVGYAEGTGKNLMVEEVNGDNKNEQCKLEDENIHMASLDVQCEGEAGEYRQNNKSMMLFKNALVELVKEILNPVWMNGQISKEVHNTIVKKVVDKVTSTEGVKIPKTQEQTDQYLSFSKPQISILIHEYVVYFKKKAISSG